ncbi:MAG: hypothetical protein OXG24_14220, partial [Gammaproteobacteria bacterium]|nr:hypothetical protein [Gammaproteobacteria bacterium]
IEDFNPDFYPKPTKPGRKDEDGVIPLQELRGGYLTKEQFTTLYTRCSRVLHTPDPFSNKQRINLNSKKDFRRVLRQLRKSQSQIIKLLTHHQFVVKDDETMYIAHTVGTDFTFHVAEFEEYEPRASC